MTETETSEVLAPADLIDRLRSHIRSRGGPTIENGAWALMLAAAAQVERDQAELARLVAELHTLRTCHHLAEEGCYGLAGGCENCDQSPATPAPQQAPSPGAMEAANAVSLALFGTHPIPTDSPSRKANDAMLRRAFAAALEAAKLEGRREGLEEAADFVQETRIASEQPSLSRIGLLGLFRDCLASRLRALASGATPPSQTNPEG